MVDKSNDLEERLATLEREVTEQRSLDKNAVHAPFCVVDDDGQVILQVDATQNGGRLTLLDGDGGQVVSIMASRYGGNITLYVLPIQIEDVGNFGNQYLELGASTTGANLIVRKATTGNIELHLSSDAMSFYNMRGEAVASIAINPDNDGGIIVLNDQEGQPIFVETSEETYPSDSNED